MLDELIDCAGSDFKFLVERILELVGQVLNSEARPLGLVEVQGFRVIAELNSVEPNEVNSALILGGDRRNGSDMLIMLSVGGVEEKESKGLAGLSVLLVVLCVDFVKDGDGEVRYPGFNILLRGRGNRIREFGRRFVEGTVKDNSWWCDASLLSDILVSGETEEVFLAKLVSCGTELRSGGFSGRWKESEGDNLVSLLEVVKVRRGDLSDSRERLPSNTKLGDSI